MDDINIEIMIINGGYCVKSSSIKGNPNYEICRRVKDYDKAVKIAQKWFEFCKSFLDVDCVSIFDETTDELIFWSREEDEEDQED